MMESVFTFYRKLVLSRPWLSVLFVLLVVGFFASTDIGMVLHKSSLD